MQAGLEGDALCRRIIHESIEYILTALVTSINVIDPEAVVFGGKFALLEPFLDESVQTELRGRIFANPIRCVPFLFGTLADETPLLGAYALVLSDLFQSPSSRSRF